MKLNFKRLEPFKVLKKISLMNYKLQLLEYFQLYLMFYISLLKPACKDALIITDAKMQLENKLDIYKVKQILN